MLTINVNELAQTPQPFITHAHGFEHLQHHLVVTVSILGIVAHVHSSQVKLLLHVYITLLITPVVAARVLWKC